MTAKGKQATMVMSAYVKEGSGEVERAWERFLVWPW